MGRLKPIGSEKLTGDAKIKRILEIAKYNEVTPQNINETHKTEYSLNLSDGNNYQIVKEKQGYIIKRAISESVSDYIEPMKNRKYYSSYSQALKRLNLLAKETNRLTENVEGTSLFGEDKKFVLKTPKPEMPDMDQQAPPSEPPAVPTPELPPAPGGDSASDMGGEMPDMEGGETPDMEGGEMPDMEGGETPDMEGGSEEKVTFKSIQKLTGKLSQKLRMLENEDGLTSENIKYVINMILSSLELQNLSDEDKEDILSKFEENEEVGDEMGGEEDMDSDMGGEDIDMDMDISGEDEMGSQKEMKETDNLDEVIDSLFRESTVDKVLSKYFEFTKKEILEEREKKTTKLLGRKQFMSRNMKEIERLSITESQELASKRFFEDNHDYKFVGISNKKNLVFENDGEQIKISPDGVVL